jgi:hypothetical protein
MNLVNVRYRKQVINQDPVIITIILVKNNTAPSIQTFTVYLYHIHKCLYATPNTITVWNQATGPTSRNLFHKPHKNTSNQLQTNAHWHMWIKRQKRESPFVLLKYCVNIYHKPWDNRKFIVAIPCAFHGEIAPHATYRKNIIKQQTENVNWW